MQASLQSGKTLFLENLSTQGPDVPRKWEAVPHTL